LTTLSDIKELLRPMANLIGERLPTTCGYALFLFHVHGPNSTIYISNAQRREMLDLLDEHIAFMARTSAANQPAPIGAPGRHDDESFASRAFRESLQEPFRRIDRIIRLHAPDGVGYALIVFEWKSDGLAYITSESRDETLRMIRAWRDYARTQQRSQQ
jgi:hypothetical protein